MPVVPGDVEHPASGVLASHLVDRVRQPYLHGGAGDAMDKLDAAIADTTATSVSFLYGHKAIQAGAYLSIDTEDMYVWSVANAGTTSAVATVERGVRGTQATAHASGALVLVNARYSTGLIFAALNEELDVLGSEGLFRMRSVTLDYASEYRAFDLSGASDMIGEPYQVWSRSSSFTTDHDWREVQHWTIQQSMPTSDFASGVALSVHGGAWDDQDLRVVYRAAFGQLDALDDDVQGTTGLPRSANKLLVVGAAMSLLTGKESRRNSVDAANGRRAASDVPSGGNTGAMRNLAALRARLLAAERANVARQWPLYRRRRVLGL